MNGRGRILIIEDDESIAGGLALNLRLEGFESEVCGDGAVALERILETRPNLVLLDITLPGRSGLEVLSDLRARHDPTPVVILSARQGEFDKVAALRIGADDYVTKPFGVAELLARIEAVLRRLDPGRGPAEAAAEGPPPGHDLLRFDDVVIDREMREVTRSGEPVNLTRLEFDLLLFFVTHAATVFDRPQLLSQVWGLDHAGSPRTVDNFVGQLRQKLEADPNRPRHFVTVRGAGYRFDP